MLSVIVALQSMQSTIVAVDAIEDLCEHAIVDHSGRCNNMIFVVDAIDDIRYLCDL